VARRQSDWRQSRRRTCTIAAYPVKPTWLPTRERASPAPQGLAAQRCFRWPFSRCYECRGLKLSDTMTVMISTQDRWQNGGRAESHRGSPSSTEGLLSAKSSSNSIAKRNLAATSLVSRRFERPGSPSETSRMYGLNPRRVATQEPSPILVRSIRRSLNSASPHLQAARYP